MFTHFDIDPDKEIIVIFSNIFTAVAMLATWVAIVATAVHLMRKADHSFTPPSKFHDYCKYCGKYERDHHDRRPLAALAVILIPLLVIVGLSVATGRGGEQSVRLGIPYSSQETVLSRYTDIVDDAVQRRTIGRLGDNTVTEVSSFVFSSTVSINSLSGLMMSVSVGEGKKMIASIPINKLLFEESGTEPGVFTTTFHFREDLPDKALVQVRDYNFEECRWAFVNFMVAKHCEVVSSTTRDVPMDRNDVLQNLDFYIAQTVENVEVNLHPSDYAVLYGAPVPGQ